MSAHPMAVLRDAYLATFRQAASGLTGPLIEPALRASDGSLVLEGALQLPARMDLVDPRRGAAVRVDTPSPRPFVRSSLEVHGVLVSIESPTWDAMSLRLLSCTPADLSGVSSWFLSWFDEDDRNAASAEGGSGVVHFLSDPISDGTDTVLVADLGSAPLEAFDSLLVVLSDLRPRGIHIGAP